MRRLTAISVFALALCQLALAQFDTATVLGRITDASGAAVPGSVVRLENVNTGVSFERMSDSSGNYEFPNVRIGQYMVSAEKSGFKVTSSDPFQVTVNARQRVDLELELGEVTETVEVTGAAMLIEADSSDRGTVIGSQQAVDLPLNGRAYADLALLTPGTSQALKGSLSGRDASYNVNGLRSSYNNFTLDGVDNNAYGTSNQGFSNQVVQIAPDAVGEFKVTTNNYSAEYGRAGGAVINATLRSGTNQFHFSAWEFLRNTKLNAVGFFKPRSGEKPNLVQNQFGAAAGGPLVKNKAFFFGDYEGFRRRQSELRFASVPTPAQKQGDLGVPVFDPYTGTPYGGNQVPLSVQTDFARRVLADLPDPNRAGSGSDGVGNNFESLPSEKIDDNKGDVKGDFYINNKTTAFGRYSHRNLDWFNPDEVPGPSGGDSNGTVYARNRSVAAGVTYTVSAVSLLEARFGFTRTEAGKTPVNFDLEHMTDNYGIPGIPRDDRIGGGLNSQQVSGFNRWGRQTSNPQFQWPDVYNPRVNFSTIKSAHSLKFGYEYQAINTQINDLSPVYGLSRYSGKFSGPKPGSGSNLYNLADFFVGAQSMLEMSRFEVLEYRQRMHFFYIQDDWKVTPKFTLNLGVRYEFATPQWDADNRLGNFDPSTGELILAKDGSLRDRSTIEPDYNNWAPRIGFAYSVTPKTVLRGGYGVSYVHFNRLGGENILGFTGPFYFRVTNNQVAPGVPNGGQPECGSGQDFATCFTRTERGFPGDFVDPSRYSTLTSRVNYQPADNRTPYVQSWHFTIQHELARDMVIDLAYVGNRGTKQIILADFNQARPNQPGENTPLQQRRPFSDYTFIQSAFSGGNTFYHGFQAKLEKRWSQGLYLVNSFTWSKAIDTAPGHLEDHNGSSSRVNFYDLAGERGLSTYDTPVNNVTAVIYDLPFGRGRPLGASWNSFTNAILGGWRTTVINTARAGYPVNVYYGPSSQFTTCSGCRPRPNYTGGDIVNDGRPISNFFNEAAISLPTDPSQPFGNLGRNVARTHSFWQMDFGLYKSFPLPRESARLEFRSEFFNLFNRSNFVAPASSASSSNFGTITGTFPARQIQFALKLYF